MSVRTTCPYCGVGCGVLVEPAGQGFSVRGDPEHPANRGRLCRKGATLAQTLDDDWRLTHPMVDGRQVSWFKALDTVAERFNRVRELHGPEAIAFYVSGQLLTEDYYVVNKLAKGYIGTPHIDTNSRLCMASAVVAHQRAFGEDLVPVCYEDLEQAALTLLVGSNMAWCHPILFSRLQAAREADPAKRLVVIDPRRTVTAEAADLHLPIRPGTDAALFNALLVHLADHGGLDEAFIGGHTDGLPAALAVAREGPCTLAALSAFCGVEQAALAMLFRWVRETPGMVSAFSMGVNQSASGSDCASAIINLHLASGRIGKPGAGPFSITGQPNAMGGREVGGLATTLAAHRGFDEAAAVQTFWGSPTIVQGPGLKAVDLFEAVHDGRIKALWIMGTNPVVSLPAADRVAAALARCPFVVVSDIARDTDTLRLAHVRLPAAGWGEKDGTVTNSERMISRQRPFRAPPGEARADWWMVCDVARRMGFTRGFDYPGPSAIFDEHARLITAGRRVLDLAACVGLSVQAYDNFPPTRWPAGCARLFTDGVFATPDGRARVHPVDGTRWPGEVGEGRFRLNTGRLRDQWHTMTRTGQVPGLCSAVPEPVVAIHPQDASGLGVDAGDLVRLSGAGGEALMRVALDPGLRPGEVFAAMHWSAVMAGFSRIGPVIQPDCCPFSGEPAFKHAMVAIERIEPDWSASLDTIARAVTGAGVYWATWPAADQQRTRLAGFGPAPHPEHLLAIPGGELTPWRYADVARGQARLAVSDAKGLVGVVVVGRRLDALAIELDVGYFGSGTLDARKRMALMAALTSKIDKKNVKISTFGKGLIDAELMKAE